jgi:MFS family permease
VDAVKELDRGVVTVDDAPAPSAGRPTLPLPWGQLLNLSAYWLGLTAIWAGLDATILPARLTDLVGGLELGRATAVAVTAGVVMPILIQPLTGAVSDYTTSRWGRRKPYIAIGASLDVLFLAALATSNTYIAIVLFYVLLQFSSNFAQGAFQGYLPDLVPSAQVARASGVMGVMIVLGQVAGTVIGSLGLILFPGEPAQVQMFWPTLGLGIVELVTAVVVLLRVREGPSGNPRTGRSWWSIAWSPWSRETLHERSFVWLVCSRLFFLAGTGAIVRFALYYLERSFGLDDKSAGATIPIALIGVVIPTALVVMPAARLSDRLGRKPIIYLACVCGAVGLSITALAPSIPIAIIGLMVVGAGAGAFLAVDWALMTDIIPKRTSGRYMGISNVGTAMAGPVAAIVGGIAMDAAARSDFAASPRAAYAVAAGFFVVAALLLRPVDPTPHD